MNAKIREKAASSIYTGWSQSLLPLSEFDWHQFADSAQVLEGGLLLPGHDAEIRIDVDSRITVSVKTREACGPAHAEALEERTSEWAEDYIGFANWYRRFIVDVDPDSPVCILGRWHTPYGQPEAERGDWTTDQWMDFNPLFVAIKDTRGRRVVRPYRYSATVHDDRDPPRFRRIINERTADTLSDFADGLARCAADTMGYPWHILNRPLDGTIWQVLNEQDVVLKSFVRDLPDLPKAEHPMSIEEGYRFFALDVSQKFRRNFRDMPLTQ